MAKESKSSKKKNIIQLRSTGNKQGGVSTGYFTTTTKPKNAKNPKNAEKLRIYKFDPRAWNEKTKRHGKHVLFVEEKFKS